MKTAIVRLPSPRQNRYARCRGVGIAKQGCRCGVDSFAAAMPSETHPYRMTAAQIVLYVGLGIVIAAELWNEWRRSSRRPSELRAPCPTTHSLIFAR